MWPAVNSLTKNIARGLETARNTAQGHRQPTSPVSHGTKSPTYITRSTGSPSGMTEASPDTWHQLRMFLKLDWAVLVIICLFIAVTFDKELETSRGQPVGTVKRSRNNVTDINIYVKNQL